MIHKEICLSVAISVKMVAIHIQTTLACFLIAIAVVNAKYFRLNFRENGRDYIEAVRTDATQNVVELEVPAHESRDALGVLNDFSNGYSAKKDYEQNICYISSIEKNFPRPEKMEETMKMTGGQFQTSKYEVHNLKTFPLRNMTRYEVGPKIAAFCYGFEMVLTAVFEKDNIGEELGRLVRGEHEDARLRRQADDPVIVTHFRMVCNRATIKNWGICPKTFNLQCKWRTQKCFFFADCYNNPANMNHVCNVSHNLHGTLMCCDIICP